MRFIWLILLLPTFLEANFGTPYLKNTKLCHIWDCINKIQGLPNFLPPRGIYELNLRSLLPQGPWQDVVDKVLDVCYGDRPRSYINTCPGQALMQCVVDQMIENCPEDSLRKDDGCAPLSSLAGMNYYFMQSRYKNLKKSLPKESRPEWFLKNYFSSKCCNLPELFNVSILNECGATSFIHYIQHQSQTEPVSIVSLEHNTQTPNSSTTTRHTDDDDLKIIGIDNNQKQDPLDCCDMDSFINPKWRTECDFHLSWDSSRLNIDDQEASTTELPTTTVPNKISDVKIVPLSCLKETCIFRKLNLISDIGTVDKDGFMKLLDNFTSTYPEWTKAKARVATHCLKRNIWEYEADCEINKVLACTFDVLSENCPHSKKGDPCKHSNVLREDILCQISSTKLRARNRHQFCGHPNLVHHDYLHLCDVDSVSRLEYVDVAPQITNRLKLKRPTCKDLTPSTTCILNKMGTLNKYKFMDYFHMRDAIRNFTDKSEWSSFREVYLSAFMSVPMYREHCNSPRKLLNIVHTMLMTCPISKRKATPQCNSIFANLTTKSKQDETQRHFDHVFKSKSLPVPLEARVDSIPSPDSVPPVRIIDIKPTPMRKRPLVILPVYLRGGDNVFRSAPSL